MAVVVGGFGFQTVTERVSKAKHIQFVSGVYLLAYWLSALLWDLILFSASCCLLLVRAGGRFMRARCPAPAGGGGSRPTNRVLR